MLADSAAVSPTNSRNTGSKSPVASPSRYNFLNNCCVFFDNLSYWWTIWDVNPSVDTSVGTSDILGTFTRTGLSPTVVSRER